MNDMKQILKSIRPDLDAALEIIAKKHGIKSMTVGRGSFTTDNFTLKIEGVFAGGISAEARRYKQSAELLGLPQIGSAFLHFDHWYNTQGLNTTGTKVLCERDDGQVYMFKPDAVQRLVKRTPQEAPA